MQSCYSSVIDIITFLKVSLKVPSTISDLCLSRWQHDRTFSVCNRKLSCLH